MNCLLYADGTRIDANQIIGNGLDGFVIRAGHDAVLKIPKIYGIYRDGVIEHVEDYGHSPEDLEQEKRIYTQLKGTTGVARCIGTSPNGITLEYYPNGTLEQYLENAGEPGLDQKQRWISDIVDVIVRCHERHVLIFDIALRNFVLAKDWSVRIIDFANSTLFSNDVNMSEANDQGCTVKVDMLHLANVIHSIDTWQKLSVDCAIELDWPDITQMPCIRDSRYSQIIEKCWRKQYADCYELQRDLKRANECLISEPLGPCSL